MRPNLSVQDLLDMVAREGEGRCIDWSKIPIVLGTPPSGLMIAVAGNNGEPPRDSWHELTKVKVEESGPGENGMGGGALALVFGPEPHGYRAAMNLVEQAGVSLGDDSENEGDS